MATLRTPITFRLCLAVAQRIERHADYVEGREFKSRQ